MTFRTTNQLKLAAGVAAIAAITLCGPVANAGVIAPELEIRLRVNDEAEQSFFPFGTQTGPTSWNWNPDYNGGAWSMTCNINADTDPQINSQIALQNNTLITNLYTLTVLLPVGAIAAPTGMGGSVGGSITDNTINGVNAFAGYGSGLQGSALYFGLVDGVGVLGLLPAPGGVFAPFDGGTNNIPATSAGLPGRTLPGPAVNGQIGIQLQFTLTPGDSIALTSFFSIEPVPAPAGLAVLGLAGLMGSRRRR